LDELLALVEAEEVAVAVWEEDVVAEGAGLTSAILHHVEGRAKGLLGLQVLHWKVWRGVEQRGSEHSVAQSDFEKEV
jgi:hypothetical protein